MVPYPRKGKATRFSNGALFEPVGRAPKHMAVETADSHRPFRAITSRYQWAEAFGVRRSVARST